MGIYSIEAITNLHVGDMGNSCNIVDKTVQRDALTNYPTIYATSLKGALRAVAEKGKPETVRGIFGGEGKEISKGNTSFNDAHLVLYPVRSNEHPYYLATCPAMLSDTIRLCELTGQSELKSILVDVQGLAAATLYGAAGDRPWVEEAVLDRKDAPDAVKQLLKRLAPGEKHLALLTDAQMNELMDALPVVARNFLDNGISKNLWYEEFVPRRSIFLTAIISQSKAEEEALDQVLLGDDGKAIKTIQIGANATVGYGVCQFRKL